MPLVSAVVSDDEKQTVREFARSRDMNESQLLRAALKKFGVQIEVERAVGAPVGNNNNPGGNPHFGQPRQTEE